MLEMTLDITTLDDSKSRVNLVADADERFTLARRFGWLEVSALSTELEVCAVGDGFYDVSGRIEADIVQSCRMSGNPVPEQVMIDVHERFTDKQRDDRPLTDPLAVSVEVIENGAIPVGEMIAQLVGLEASPWPRDPEFVGEMQTPDNSTNPFALLAELKKKR